MSRMPFWLTLTIAVVLGVLGGRAVTAQDTGPDKEHPAGAGWARVLRVQGNVGLGRLSPSVPGRTRDGSDPRQSRDDRGLQGRRSRLTASPSPNGAKMAKIHWDPKKMKRRSPLRDGAGHAP